MARHKAKKAVVESASPEASDGDFDDSVEEGSKERVEPPPKRAIAEPPKTVLGPKTAMKSVPEPMGSDRAKRVNLFINTDTPTLSEHPPFQSPPNTTGQSLLPLTAPTFVGSLPSAPHATPPAIVGVDDNSTHVQKTQFSAPTQPIRLEPAIMRPPASRSVSQTKTKTKQKGRKGSKNVETFEEEEPAAPALPPMQTDPGPADDIAAIVDPNHASRGNYVIFRLSPFAERIYTKPYGVMMLRPLSEIGEKEANAINEEYQAIQASLNNQVAYLSRQPDKLRELKLIK